MSSVALLSWNHSAHIGLVEPRASLALIMGGCSLPRLLKPMRWVWPCQMTVSPRRLAIVSNAETIDSS